MGSGGQWIYNDYRYRGVNTGQHYNYNNSSDYSMWGLIASAVAGFASAAVNLWSTYQNNKTASSQYSQQYALQKDSLYNGHQIETADMAKAGLNPLLSGSGASTSQVSTASNQTTGNIDLLSPLLNAYQQHENLRFSKEQFSFDKSVRSEELSLEQRKTDAEVLRSISQSDLSNAQKVQVLQNLGLIEAQKENVQQSTKNLRASLSYINQQIESLKIQNAGALTENEIKKIQLAMNESQLTFEEFEHRFWQMAGIPQSAAGTLSGSNVGAGVLSGILTLAGIANKNEADTIASGLEAKAMLADIEKNYIPLRDSKRPLSSSELRARDKLKNQYDACQEAIKKAERAWTTRKSHLTSGSNL